MMSRSSSVARLQAAVVGLRARHQWIDHLLRAGVRYHERHGNHFAAAITFFSILNAVPLLMIAYATAGYVLALNLSLLVALDAGIARAVPPELSHRARQPGPRTRFGAGRGSERSTISSSGTL